MVDKVKGLISVEIDGKAITVTELLHMLDQYKKQTK